MIELADYSISQCLHEGSETAVYSGLRRRDNLPVVVKMPRDDHPLPTVLNRLRHEYALLREYAQPGVVQGLELVRSQSSLALVLEYVEGEPLTALVRSRKLDLALVLRIGLELAQILTRLHDRHVVHKDLKPHNVLYNPQTGAVTLLDFGIASCLSHETQPGHGPGAVEGTLAYMSPEQTGRMNRLLDTRSDLYSLGVTLYELLTYTLPFTSTDALALIHCHIARRPPTPQELNSRVPAIVSDVVMRLLAKASEDRYQTAAGLAADLRECLTQLQSKGEISDFPLGRSDFSAELRVPQRLYGRQAEQQVLSAALHRAAAGSAELVLISGYPGVGKTALVHEMYSRVVAQGGFFAEGKFDQFSSSAPMAQVLFEAEETATLREDVEGPNAEARPRLLTSPAALEAN